MSTPGHCVECERLAELSIVRLASAEALERAAKSPRVLLSMLEEMAAYLRSGERPADWQWFGGHLLRVIEAVNDIGRVVAGAGPEGSESASIRSVRASRRGTRGPTRRDAKIARMAKDYLAMERRIARLKDEVERLRAEARERCP